MSFPIGTVISGRLRDGDLRDAFERELESVGAVLNESYEDVNEMIDHLNEFAPPYLTFGTHEGDGADFGWWPMVEALDEDARYGDVLKVNDLSEIPENYEGDIMLVSDHGNVTYGYHVEGGQFHEVWSCA